MAKKGKKVLAVIHIGFGLEGPDVGISNFEHLSPVKIELCFEAVMKEWYRLRGVSIQDRKKLERSNNEAVEIGVENG